MKLLRIVTPMLLLSFSNSCLAQISEDLMVCSQKKDSLVRLLCYDEIAKSLNSDQAKVANHTSSKNNNRDGVDATARQVAATGSQTTAKISPTTEQITTDLQQVEKFGSENITSKPSAQSEQLTEVIFTIKSVEKSIRGKWNIVFDNDQKWKQTGSDKIKLTVGDQVEVSKGALGSYRLKKVGSKRTIRVKRSK